MVNELIILIILIAFSAFVSATEFAFVVANKIKIELKARQKNLAAINAFYFIKNPQHFFSTILIGNIAANITFASLLAVFLAFYFGMGDITILLITSLVIILFGEMLPKYFARELADHAMLIAAIPIRLLSLILYPFIKITSWLSNLLTRSQVIKEDTINLLFNREEIQMLLHESKEPGIVDKNESAILNRILELGDRRVYEAMRPRTEIVGVEITCSINEALNVFIESGFSKLPVYEDNLDNIKGVVFAYDLFKKPADLKSIIRDVIFVPDTKICAEMLTEFSKKRISFAVAIDEFGGTAGILTMEDIIEELFGEIRDEYDTDDEICKKVSENQYVIGGKVEIDYINETLNLDIPQGDYSTIAGYIIYNIGRIPQQGENIVVGNFNVLIIRSSNKRIELLKMTKIHPESVE